MIKVEHIDVYGWETAIRGMRNPMNSWDKSDSKFYIDGCLLYPARIGKNDLTLMKKLCKAGTDHRKFMRMITVDMDITAPLYWWKEYDTYKVGTVANSCSTMHKIHAKEFTLDDFSCEHLTDKHKYENDGECFLSCDYNECLKTTISYLNGARNSYLLAKKMGDKNAKEFWWQMIQLLPTSYNQRRTVQLNYEVLANMYHSRKAHKLDEWVSFCKEIEKLPYSELITGVEK